MRRVMVRYRVKPEYVARNEELVRAVYAELDRTRPEGLRYATSRLDDGVSFVHIAVTDGDGPNRLNEVEAFAEFQKDIGARCDEPPVVTELHEIGNFRLF
jgi:hypothetical protein